MGTFFTPISELGVTYYKMHYVSGLPYGEFPYEEYFPLAISYINWENKCPKLSRYTVGPLPFQYVYGYERTAEGRPLLHLVGKVSHHRFEASKDIEDSFICGGRD